MKKISELLFITLLTISFSSCNNESQPLLQPEPTPVIVPDDEIAHVFINTNGAEIVDEPKINAEIIINVDGAVDYQGNIGIEIRGSSSQFFPKKQFGFETRDEANEDLDVSLLGLPEEEDWILQAPFSDKSLLRNKLMYDLSLDIGRYASRSKFVDVTINNSYNGVYLLMEKLKRDDNRIAINKLKDDENSGEDLTGGYIVKIDKADGQFGMEYTSTNSFTSTHLPNNATAGQTTRFVYDTPKEDAITPEQKNYIANYIADFEDALASNNFTNPTTGYQAFIETDSFVDFFLLNELANNVDGYRLSTRLVKDKNEKLKMGPIWDFNLAFGNADYCSGGETNVWAYKFNERCSGDFWVIPFWWERLLQDPAFVQQVKNRWVELRSNQFSNTVITQKIETYIATLSLSNSIERNFSEWPILGSYVWPNNYVGANYNDEKNYLINFINSRLAWLDASISGL